MHKNTVILMIFFVTSLHGSQHTNQAYDDLDSNDFLTPEVALQWGLEKYCKRNVARKPIDEKKQLKLVKFYLYDQGDIEKIKNFYERNKETSYDDPYYIVRWQEGFSIEHSNFPIEWALTNEHIEFARWLLEEKKVTVQNVGQIFFKSTCNNSVQKLRHHPPIVWYVRKITDIPTLINKKIFPTIFHLLFSHGAHIFDQNKKANDNNENYNPIFYALKSSCALSIIAHLFYEWTASSNVLTGVEHRKTLIYNKKSYDNYFMTLWLYNKKNPKYKVPKPLMHAICKLAAHDGEKIMSIKAILNDTKSFETQQKRLCKQTWHRSLTPLDVVVLDQKNKQENSLTTILKITFWDKSLYLCQKELKSIIENTKLEKK